MCKEQRDFPEVQLGIQQLQGLVNQVELSNVQWKQYLEQLEMRLCHADFDMISDLTLELHQALLRIEQKLKDQHEGNGPFITITSFK